jgi:hypothetical protein
MCSANERAASNRDGTSHMHFQVVEWTGRPTSPRGSGGRGADRHAPLLSTTAPSTSTCKVNPGRAEAT